MYLNIYIYIQTCVYCIFKHTNPHVCKSLNCKVAIQLVYKDPSCIATVRLHIFQYSILIRMISEKIRSS